MWIWKKMVKMVLQGLMFGKHNDSWCEEESFPNHGESCEDRGFPESRARLGKEWRGRGAG